MIKRGYEGYAAKDGRGACEAGATRRGEGQAEGLDGQGARVAASDELGAGSLIVTAPPLAHAPRCATLSAVTLLTELDAFYLDHRRCGELDAGVEGPTVWFDCECGARIARRADDGDAFDLDA